MPTAAFAAEIQEVETPEIEAPNDTATTIAEPSPAYPMLDKAAGALRSTLHTLGQMGHCLLHYDACSKRDKLAISMAFGFIMGYGIDYKPLMQKLLNQLRHRYGPFTPTRDYFITSLAYSIAGFIGLTGPLLMSKSSGTLKKFLLEYSTAPDKAQYLNEVKYRFYGFPAFLKIVLMLSIAIEATSILQETAYAITYKKKSPLIALASYLRMNLLCIWSETYCQPQQNAAQRRLGLYFWLGYLQGIGLRQLRSRFPSAAPTPTFFRPPFVLPVLQLPVTAPAA